MSELSEKSVYRVQGFSCANCAAKFERNVKEIDGVSDAMVNFGAAKLTVYGSTTIDKIEQAGSFENLKIRPEKSREALIKKEPFLVRNASLVIASLLIIIGFISKSFYGEEALPTVLSFLFSIAIGGYRLFQTGIKNLIRFEFDMRTLMTIAIIGAALIGEWTEGAVVVILFAISEVLEAFSMDKARESIRSLMNIAPKEALIRRGKHEVVIDVDDIVVGDIMIVKPGQKIAMDGVIRAGTSAINQAAITGESIPLEKVVNDEVYAGTLNGEGLLEVKVSKHVDDTTISKIIHLVEEAQAERAPAQAFVDQFAKYYTPAIVILAGLVAIFPPLLFGSSWEQWIYQGLSVLVVGCPCALVISTPVSIVTAIGNAARNGVLIKGGIYLEEAASIEAIAFDKTGTLTKGEPIVTNYIEFEQGNNSQFYGKWAALESRSHHPLAGAVIKKADVENIPFRDIKVEQFSALTGQGIKGTIEGIEYFIGSPKMALEQSGKVDASISKTISEWQKQGKTVMVGFTRTTILAIMAVADELRKTSEHTIKRLHKLGIKQTIMLTGDNEGTAKTIAQKAGVTDYQAELFPEGKLTYIKQLRQTYKKVAMVGDGVNDAPALAAATIGIAMGGEGTDTALETADIALMGDDLTKLPFLIVLSRKTLTIIKQNISFSILVKLLALLLVIPGWLTLWIAIFADMGATLLVTLNGLRLLKINEK